MTMTPLKSSHGLTLLEVIIALAVAAILAMAGAPSFDNYIRNNGVYADRKLLNTALMGARYEAVARNKTVSMCSSSTGTDCSGTWSQGWIVFLDDGDGGGTARDGEHNGSERILNAFVYQGSNIFTMVDVAESESLSYLSFNEYGRPAVGGEQINRPILIQICDSKLQDNYARGLMLIGSGRLIQTIDSDGNGIHESRFANGANTLSLTSDLSCSS